MLVRSRNVQTTFAFYNSRFVLHSQASVSTSRMKSYQAIISFIFLGLAYVNGGDYAIGYLHLGTFDQGSIMQSNILMTAAGRAEVNVSMEILNQTVKIKGGGYFRFVMNPLFERAKKNREVEDTAVFMTSDQDFCVSAVTLDFESFGAFHPQPITENSTEFYIPSYTTRGRHSTQFLIVSPDGDTTVRYMLRNRHTGEYDPELNITLHKHHKYQIQSMSWDYTGSYVTSDKPIAVFAGVDCARVPPGDANQRSCDHMSVGVPPVANLGKRYIVAPLADRKKDNTGYVVRIISTYDNTTVDANKESKILPRGDFWEINVNESSVVLDVRCSDPCMVIQYGKSKVHRDEMWDNFMLTVPAVKDYTNKQIWTNPVDRHGLATVCYCNIVVPKGKQDGVLVDDRKVTNPWTPSPGGDYMVATVRRLMGAHNARHIDNVTKIGVTNYGRGTKETHAFGFSACPAGDQFLPDIEETDEEDDDEDPGDGGDDGIPEAEALCSGGDPGHSSLWGLWIILCVLAGLIIGISLGLTFIWLRVRKMTGVAKFVFNPFYKIKDGMDVDLVATKNTPEKTLD